MNQKANAYVNPSSPNPRQRENIKLIFYFQTTLWCLKKFYEGLKGVHKTFRGIKKGMKIMI